MGNHSSTKKRQRGMTGAAKLRGTLASLLVSVLVGALVGFLWKRVSWPRGQGPVSGPAGIYEIEITALDHAGYPRAGALVYLDHKKVGRTDAYGRWHRSFEVAQAQLLHLRVVKVDQQQRLVAERSVPLTGRAERLLRLRLQLSLAETKTQNPVSFRVVRGKEGFLGQRILPLLLKEGLEVADARGFEVILRHVDGLGGRDMISIRGQGHCPLDSLVPYTGRAQGTAKAVGQRIRGHLVQKQCVNYLQEPQVSLFGMELPDTTLSDVHVFVEGVRVPLVVRRHGWVFPWEPHEKSRVHITLVRADRVLGQGQVQLRKGARFRLAAQSLQEVRR